MKYNPTLLVIWLLGGIFLTSDGYGLRDNKKKQPFFSLTTKSTWQEYAGAKSKQSSGTALEKKVLVGQINLKSKEIMFLESLKACWQGGNIGGVVASLYSKKITDHKNMVPIEANLICDGTWNPKKKEFIFPVNKKLVASDTYYLMLHINKKCEPMLKAGSFQIESNKKCARLSLHK